MNQNTSLPRSTLIRGIEWLSERIPYPDMSITGDTFPLTWADDDAIYMSSGDPMWRGIAKDEGLDVEKMTGMAPHYQITRVCEMYHYRGYGGNGPKPSGMICVKGVLYFAFQNMLGSKPPVHGEKCQHGSDAHIIVSRDHGLSWENGLPETTVPMFPGPLFGGPAFVNYGCNNEGASDGYVYSVSGDQWDNGSELRLGRVPSDQIVEATAWEWVSEITDDNQVIWTRELNNSIPVLSWDRHISLPEMVYLKRLDRYLLLTFRLHEDFTTKGTDLIILESPNPWGPFSLVHQEVWENAIITPYCPRIPLKWMEPDGLTGWLLHSGSWNCPEDQGALWRPYYRVNIRKFRFLVD